MLRQSGGNNFQFPSFWDGIQRDPLFVLSPEALGLSEPEDPAEAAQTPEDSSSKEESRKLPEAPAIDLSRQSEELSEVEYEEYYGERNINITPAWTLTPLAEAIDTSTGPCPQTDKEQANAEDTCALLEAEFSSKMDKEKAQSEDVCASLVKEFRLQARFLRITSHLTATPSMLFNSSHSTNEHAPSQRQEVKPANQESLQNIHQEISGNPIASFFLDSRDERANRLLQVAINMAESKQVHLSCRL